MTNSVGGSSSGSTQQASQTLQPAAGSISSSSVSPTPAYRSDSVQQSADGSSVTYKAQLLQGVTQRDDPNDRGDDANLSFADDLLSYGEANQATSQSAGIPAGSGAAATGAAATGAAASGTSAPDARTPPSAASPPPLSDAEYLDAAGKAGIDPNPQIAARNDYSNLRRNAAGAYDSKYRDTTKPDNLFNPANQSTLDQPTGTNQPDVHRMHMRDGWIRTYNGGGGTEKQVVSMNVEPSKEMVSKLDSFMQAHKDCVSQYKYPENEAAWATRRDPITMYVTDPEKFKSSGAQQELEGIIQGHNRTYDPGKAQKFQQQNPGKEMPNPDGKLIGQDMGPGAKIADYPSPSDIEALKNRAQSISPEVSAGLERDLKGSNQLSVGQFKAWQNTMDKLQNNSRLAIGSGGTGAAGEAGKPAKTPAIDPAAAAKNAANAGAQAASDAAQSAAKAGESTAGITAAATQAAKNVATTAVKAAGPAAAVAGLAVGDGLNIANLVNAVKSGDKEAQKEAGKTLAADWATGGLYSLFKHMADQIRQGDTTPPITPGNPDDKFTPSPFLAT